MEANKKIKQPTSKFIEVECIKCGEKSIVFDKASTKVVCAKCGDVLAEPMGGFAFIVGKKIKDLD